MRGPLEIQNHQVRTLPDSNTWTQRNSNRYVIQPPGWVGSYTRTGGESSGLAFFVIMKLVPIAIELETARASPMLRHTILTVPYAQLCAKGKLYEGACVSTCQSTRLGHSSFNSASRLCSHFTVQKGQSSLAIGKSSCNDQSCDSRG